MTQKNVVDSTRKKVPASTFEAASPSDPMNFLSRPPYLPRQPKDLQETGAKNDRESNELGGEFIVQELFIIPQSSSLDSPSSSSAAFCVVFFFFFLFLLFDPVDLATGCSRIFKISSSVICLPLLTCSRSSDGGAARRVRPFLVIATRIN